MANKWPFDRRDGVLLAGFTALVYGAGLAWPPAGWITAGMLLLAYWATPIAIRMKGKG